DRTGAPPDPAGAGVRQDAHRAGHPDDEERGGDRLPGGQPSDVHQQGHGEDRPAAAEQAEADPDQHGQPDGQRDTHRRSPRSWLTMVSKSQLAPRLYGSLASSMPSRQVLVRAAMVRPAPMRPATHLRPGTNTEPRMLRRTMEPATSRTCRSSSHRGSPSLIGALAACQARSPPLRTLGLGRPISASAFSAWVARAPERQISTTSSSMWRRSSSRCSLSRSRGTLYEPGMCTVSNSAGVRTSISRGGRPDSIRSRRVATSMMAGPVFDVLMSPSFPGVAGFARLSAGEGSRQPSSKYPGGYLEGPMRPRHGSAYRRDDSGPGAMSEDARARRAHAGTRRLRDSYRALPAPFPPTAYPPAL